MRISRKAGNALPSLQEMRAGRKEQGAKSGRSRRNPLKKCGTVPQQDAHHGSSPTPPGIRGGRKKIGDLKPNLRKSNSDRPAKAQRFKDDYTGKVRRSMNKRKRKQRRDR